jgi:flagellar biosynthesis anti-sigma factor FlgM
MPDAVSLSATARHMRIATEAIQALGEVRQGKVNEIRQLLEQGKYQPSEQEIADSIMRRAIERQA